jgi:LemA protein
MIWNSLWFHNQPFQNFTVADDAMQPPKVDFGTQQQGG